MRLLVFAVLAIAAVSGNLGNDDEVIRELLGKCKPGTQYDGIVHRFYCRKDGSGYDYIVKNRHPGNFLVNPVPKEGTRCVPGRRWLNDDKICVCPSDASRSVCTNTVGSKKLDLSSRICLAKSSIPRASSNDDAKSCNPGDIVLAELNICACTSDGSGWICANTVDSVELRLSSKMMSHRGNSTYSAADTKQPMDCTPGDVIVDDNGICTCVNDGKGQICAINASLQSLHLTSKICNLAEKSITGPSTDDKNLCNAGDNFVSHNEMCVCSSDRTAWICYKTVGTGELHISSKIGQRNDSSSGVTSEVGCSPGSCYLNGNTVCCCVDDGSGSICGSTVGSEKLHLTSKIIGNRKDSTTSGAANKGQVGCSAGDCYTDGSILCCCAGDGSSWICGKTVGSQNFNLTRKSVDAENPISGSSVKDVESCNPGDAVVHGLEICVCARDGSGWICTRDDGSEKLQLIFKTANRNDTMISGISTDEACTPGTCRTAGNIICCCEYGALTWICIKTVGSKKLHLTSKTGNRNDSITPSSPTEGQVGCSPGDCSTNGKIFCCCVSDGSGRICGENDNGIETIHLTSRTDNRKDSKTFGAANEGQVGCSHGECYPDGDELCCCASDGLGFICTSTVGSKKLYPFSAAATNSDCTTPGDVFFSNSIACVCISTTYNQLCFQADGAGKIRLLNPF